MAKASTPNIPINMLPASFRELMNVRRNAEKREVRALGDRIGYGNVMALAEQIWNDKDRGAAHSVGPCVAFLVPCRHIGYTPINCDWCCGAGRVTKKVDEVMGR